MKRIFFVLALFFATNFILFSNSYSGASDNEAFILRAPIWVFLEPSPGYFTEENKEKFIPPKDAIRELSRFVLGGMSYGWKFSYTPYDKKRQVKEFFEIKPIFTINKKSKNIKIKDVDIKYPYCYCWAEYKLPDTYKMHYAFWKSGEHKTIKGRGVGNRSEELQGVYKAYTEATKNAIREYARTILKNKPKEIIGEVLIKENPRLFVKSGYFNAEIQCYLKIKEIIPYTVF